METRRDAPDHEVAKAAFQIWEAEGRPEGMAEEHWHRAKLMLEARAAFAEAAEAPAGAAAPEAGIPPAGEAGAGAAGTPAPLAAGARKPRAPRRPPAPQAE